MKQAATKTDISYLGRPLIKCRADFANAQGNFHGFASGKRSAILVDTNDQSFIRLKGCGNLDQGFPLEPMAFPMDSEEVRGCQFENTVFREMYYQKIVNDLLESEKLTGANIPLGLWKYDRFDDIETEGIQNACKGIQKYCGIFRTLGDRRL